MTRLNIWAIVIALGLACLAGLSSLHTIAAEPDAEVGASVTVIEPTPTAGGGGVPGGGSVGGGAGPGSTTNLIEYVSETGRFIAEAVAESVDGGVTLYIPEGTIARRNNGQNLRSVTIKEYTVTLEPPADCQFVCLIYDIGPGDTAFTPSARLTFKYTEADVPVGVVEEDMVFAVWQNDKWVELQGGIVNSLDNTVTVPITHLSIYTVMAHVSPASFKVSDLSIIPSEVYSSQAVTISALVSNRGDLTGNFEAILKINNVIFQTQTFMMNGGDSRTVRFTVDSDTTGEYIVDVNGLSGSFIVKAPEPEATIVEVPAPRPPPSEPPSESLPIPLPEDEPPPVPPVTPAIEPPLATVPVKLTETQPIQQNNNRMRIITFGTGVFLVGAALLTLLIGRRRF